MQQTVVKQTVQEINSLIKKSSLNKYQVPITIKPIKTILFQIFDSAYILRVQIVFIEKKILKYSI